MSKEMIRIVTTDGLRICHPTEDLFEGVSAMQGGIFMVDNRSGEEQEWTWSVRPPRSPEATPAGVTEGLEDQKRLFTRTDFLVLSLNTLTIL